MHIEKCLANIRCDTANCHKFSKYNINTNGYKKNICLCECCFNELYSQMQSIKKELKLKRMENNKWKTQKIAKNY